MKIEAEMKIMSQTLKDSVNERELPGSQEVTEGRSGG